MTVRWMALAQRIRLETGELDRTVSAVARAGFLERMT